MGAVVLQQAASVSPSWVTVASDLLRTLSALGFVCLLAWLALRFVASRGVGRVVSGKRLEVVERLTLDPQRSLLIVRVDQRRLLIGIGAGAAPRLLLELDSAGPSSIGSNLTADDLALVQDAVRPDASH